MHKLTCWNDITIRRQLEGEMLLNENPDFKPLAVVAGYTNTLIDEVKEILSSFTFLKEPLPTYPISEFEYKGDTC